MFDKIANIWKIKELRQSILYILGVLVIFRFAAHIPIPGVNVENLRAFFSSNELLGLLNLFSGGGMQNFSIVMLGVAPYITASIIFQLLAMIVPKLEEMNKDEAGRHKINTWTRWLTIPLSALQSYSMIVLLQRSTTGILGDMTTFDMV